MRSYTAQYLRRFKNIRRRCAPFGGGIETPDAHSGVQWGSPPAADEIGRQIGQNIARKVPSL